MKPRIVKQPELRVVGLSGRFAVGQTDGIPDLWGRFAVATATAGRSFPGVTYGLCYDEDEGGAFTYMAAFELGPETPPEGMEVRTVPANRYAVFTHRGPIAGIGETWAAIFTDWLPASGYRPDPGPQFERYDDRFDPVAMAGEVDIYVPVEKADK